MNTRLSTSLNSEPTKNAKQSSVFPLYGFAVFCIMVLGVMWIPIKAEAETLITVGDSFTCPTLTGNTAYTVRTGTTYPYLTGVNSPTATTYGGITCDGANPVNLVSSMTGQASGDYTLIYGQAPSNVYDVAGGTVFYGFFNWDGTTIVDIGNDTTTRIDSVTPYDGEVIATSTIGYLEFSGYLNPDDNNGHVIAQIVVQNGSCKMWGSGTGCATADNDGVWVFDVPVGGNDDEVSYFDRQDIPDSTTFNYSVARPELPVGTYWVDISIYKKTGCVLGLCLGDIVSLVSTSTTFTASTTSVYDKFVLAKEKGDISDADLFACDLGGSFDFLQCMQNVALALFIPSQQEVTDNINAIKAGAFSHKPLGYITVFYDIVSGNRQDSLPTLSYTFATTSLAVPTQLMGATISFNPWLYMASSTGVIKDIVSIGGNQTAKNVWDITMSTIDMFIYFGLIVMIIGQLLNINFVGSSTENFSQDKEYSGINKYTGNQETRYTSIQSSSTRSGGARYKGRNIL